MGEKVRIHYPADSVFPISRAVRAGDFVFTYAVGDHGFRPEDVVYDERGLVVSDGTDNTKQSLETEIRGTLRNIEQALAQAGAALSDVVDMQVWLRDPRDFPEFNRVYSEYYKTDVPVRSVFRTDFMFDCRIEIKVVAYRPL